MDVQAAQEIASRVHTAEQLYFNMFPSENTEKFRRFLLYVVYTTIKENSGITTNKLQWRLDNEFSLKPEDVEIAVNALANRRIFGAVSKYHLRNRPQQESNRQIIHLRLRKNKQDVIGAWSDYVSNDCPELAEINTGNA
tara:strand:- start:616 stop:1032 length:417 start_codon:yes stop_codon:yes gene_type:complete